jgi:hypothetical protein
VPQPENIVKFRSRIQEAACQKNPDSHVHVLQGYNKKGLQSESVTARQPNHELFWAPAQNDYSPPQAFWNLHIKYQSCLEHSCTATP